MHALDRSRTGIALGEAAKTFGRTGGTTQSASRQAGRTRGSSAFIGVGSHRARPLRSARRKIQAIRRCRWHSLVMGRGSRSVSLATDVPAYALRDLPAWQNLGATRFPLTQCEADALAEAAAREWDEEPEQMLRRMAFSYALARPAGRRLRRAVRIDEIITADDWRRLISQHWREMKFWRAAEIAKWADTLIRERTAVQIDKPVRQRMPSSAPPAQDVALKMFLFLGGR